MTDKFKLMSSCVICLVIAREIFLPQVDFSVVTKVHDFSLLLYNLLALKIKKKVNKNFKNGGYFIQIG